MDPISAMATASAAFSALKKGFAIGRDIESMASDLSRWMGALSDLDQMKKKPKIPLFSRSYSPARPLSKRLLKFLQQKTRRKNSVKSSSGGFSTQWVSLIGTHWFAWKGKFANAGRRLCTLKESGGVSLLRYFASCC